MRHHLGLQDAAVLAMGSTDPGPPTAAGAGVVPPPHDKLVTVHRAVQQQERRK